MSEAIIKTVVEKHNAGFERWAKGTCVSMIDAFVKFACETDPILGKKISVVAGKFLAEKGDNFAPSLVEFRVEGVSCMLYKHASDELCHYVFCKNLDHGVVLIGKRNPKQNTKTKFVKLSRDDAVTAAINNWHYLKTVCNADVSFDTAFAVDGVPPSGLF